MSSSNLRRLSQSVRTFVISYKRNLKSAFFNSHPQRIFSINGIIRWPIAASYNFNITPVAFQFRINDTKLNTDNYRNNSIQSPQLSFLTLAGIFSFFQTKEDEEESELIMTIKRAVLLIQHDEFKAAEQMLHVALRLAQQTQNSDGITYVYDLLANVAFSQGELDKAEVLFRDVMQRVLAQGTAQDDLKIIHMSLKMAKIYELKHDWAKAEEGYKFCKKQLDTRARAGEDEDALMLWGMTMDYYARFLHERDRLEEALEHYKKAYDVCVRINGDLHENTVVLLNDLGTISFLRGDNDAAIEYMLKAVEAGRHLPNMHDFSSVYVNLGNIYMQKEMYSEASKHCTEGMKNAKRHHNDEGLKEATICLDELKRHFK